MTGKANLVTKKCKANCCLSQQVSEGRGHALWLVALGKIDGILIPKCTGHLKPYVRIESELIPK